VPLYQHFADLAGNGAKLTLPVPCFNVINGGSHAGKRVGLMGNGAMFGDGAETRGLNVRPRHADDNCVVYYVVLLELMNFDGDYILFA